MNIDILWRLMFISWLKKILKKPWKKIYGFFISLPFGGVKKFKEMVEKEMKRQEKNNNGKK